MGSARTIHGRKGRIASVTLALILEEMDVPLLADRTRTVLLPFRSRAHRRGCSIIGRQEAVVGQAQSRFIERASWLLRLPLETPTIPFDDVQSGCTLWLKLDYLLPSGCTKDRM